MCTLFKPLNEEKAMPLNENKSSRLYEQVADHIAGMIEARTYRPGERIPSVREMSAQKRISVTTVLQAYGLLESQGLIEARPQSGYYVRSRTFLPPNVIPQRSVFTN